MQSVEFLTMFFKIDIMRLFKMLAWVSFIGQIFTLTSLAQVSVSTSIPNEVKSGQSFLVELTVTKGNVSGFGKLEFDVPEGYVAEQVQVNGSSFGASGTKVKFVWMAMPEDTVFSVTYKLKPLGNEKGVLIVGGRIVYAYNGEPRQHVISPKAVAVGVGFDVVQSLLSMSRDSMLPGFIAESSVISKQALLKRDAQNVKSNQNDSGYGSKGYGTSAEMKSDALLTAAGGDGQLNASGRQDKSAQSASASSGKNKSEVSGHEMLTSGAGSRSSNASPKAAIHSDQTYGDDLNYSNREPVRSPAKEGILDLNSAGMFPIDGVSFRVQVAALTTNKRTPEQVTAVYDIPDVLMTENDEGAMKFMISQEFTLYRAAKIKANELRETTSSPGPFVVSYLNGARVHITQTLRTMP